MTEIFVPENPPVMQTEDGRTLAEYLNRQMLAISSLLKSTQAGHAGLYLSAADSVAGTITSTPSKITAYDAKWPGDEGAFADVPNDSLVLQEAGLWLFGIQAVYDIVSSSANTAREVGINFYNESSTSTLFTIATATIPRYGAALTISGTVMANIPVNLIGHVVSTQIQTLDGSSVSFNRTETLNFFMVRVSNYVYTGV